MRRLSILLLLLLACTLAKAQTDTLLVAESGYTKEFLDTVQVSKAGKINDYSMIGINYGVSLNSVSFNPVKQQGMLLVPVNFGISFTKYGKLFGLLPYFGFSIGLSYGQNGYKFGINRHGEYEGDVDGAHQAKYSFIELPFLSHFHADIWRIKLIAEAGLYGAWRLSVEREGESVDPKYLNNFYPYENQIDYGAKFGAGIAFMIDPVELHFKAQYKWSWSSLYKPDYASEYYYRFAYPMDIYISAGLHFQLQKRTGKTKAQLRKDAYKQVFEPETIEKK